MANILDLFPTSSKPPYDTYAQYSGLSEAIDGRRLKFTPPSEQTKLKVQDALRALVKYEDDRSGSSMRRFKRKLDAANMAGRKFNGRNDVLFFFPRDIEEVSANIFWRLGLVQQPGVPQTYDNPVHPLGICQEHPRRDITMSKALQLFLKTKAKYMVTYGLAPRISGLPSDCPKQTSSVLSDPSHSMSTMLTPIMKLLLQEIYPYSALIQPHTASNIKKMLMVNSKNYQFLRTGERSFNVLFALAFLAENPGLMLNSISLGSTMPGSVLVNGMRFKLTDQIDNAGFFNLNKSPHSSNVMGHLANYGGCSYGPVQLDRAAHCEWGTDFYKNVDGKFDAFVNSVNTAMPWYVHYDPLKHNPWSEQIVTPVVYNDFSKYGSLFDPTPTIRSTQPIKPNGGTRSYVTSAMPFTKPKPVLFTNGHKLTTSTFVASAPKMLRRALRT